MQEIKLKYGTNPNQKNARILSDNLPVTVLNGQAGYINFLDALNAWQLVKELSTALNLPAATSFKHVSPSGAAVGTELNEMLRRAYLCENAELTPLASAYARARGADRMSSFGDFIALSDECDEATALLIKKEVSDGVIAPSFTKDALEILKKKRDGNYCVIKIDKDYVPTDSIEKRTVYGVTFEQQRNDIVLDYSVVENIVTANKTLPQSAKLDLLISLITLKYTQSNSVCFAFGGQTVGVGAGQQSRIHCTRIAGDKADNYFLRQHPFTLDLQFKEDIKRAERDNAIDLFVSGNKSFEENWSDYLKIRPSFISAEEKTLYLSKVKGIALGSDAFFPFADNIARASESGVGYIAQPGGSKGDSEVISACNNLDIVMAFTGIRLFHH